jgi:NitT/TauT family transport system substrate-binding protein
MAKRRTRRCDEVPVGPGARAGGARTTRWLLCGLSGTALAQDKQIRIARQTSIAYLQLYVIERGRLIERYARELGAPDAEVTWTTINGANTLNDALIAGRLDVATGGVAGLLTIWGRTQGTPREIRGICTFQSGPLLLNTTRPGLRSLRDLQPDDRIAVPAVRVAAQAIFLQMAAARLYGPDQYARFDPLAVSLSPADATIALLSGSGGITAAFTAPPFQEQQLKDPRVHTVLNTFELTGGSHSAGVAWTTAAFREKNPILYRAFLAAMREATDIINRDKRAAASLYLEAMKLSMKLDDAAAVVSEREVTWTMVPERTRVIADFMASTGQIPRAADWKSYFFPEIHDLPGS